MKADLGLSEEQSAKLKGNREAMREKMKTIREDKSLNDESKKEKVKELMKKQKEEMKSILTDEQLKKLEEQKKQKPSRKKVHKAFQWIVKSPDHYRGTFLIIFAPHQITVVKQQASTHEKEIKPFRQVYQKEK